MNHADVVCLNWLLGVTCGLGAAFTVVVFLAACRISGRITRREEGLMLCGHHVDELRCSDEGTHWCAACEEEAE